MSKTKIVNTHRDAVAALRSLNLPSEAAPLLKELDRAFAELRGLHSAAERDRQEACSLVAQKEEALKKWQRAGEEALVQIERLERQVMSLASHLVDRVSGRESQAKFDAETARLQHELERLGVEFLVSHPNLVSLLLPLVTNLVETMNGHSETVFRIFEQDLATYQKLLCLACHQKGPLRLADSPPEGGMILDLNLRREGGEWSLWVQEP